MTLQVDSFQEYVKPELNPKLSDFCVNLTGITQVSQVWSSVISVLQYNREFLLERVKCFVGQKMVDEADTFPGVLERVVAWLQERELGTKYKYAILTDGYVLKESGVFITFLLHKLKSDSCAASVLL